MKNPHYTVGEILRLGLLKNHKGEPYKNKVTILRLVSDKADRVQTPWGMGYSIPRSLIKDLNNRW